MLFCTTQWFYPTNRSYSQFSHCPINFPCLVNPSSPFQISIFSDQKNTEKILEHSSLLVIREIVEGTQTICLRALHIFSTNITFFLHSLHVHKKFVGGNAPRYHACGSAPELMTPWFWWMTEVTTLSFS